MSATVISWKTRKAGQFCYEWTVYSFGYQQPTTVLKSGSAATRAIATRMATKWCAALKREAAA